jgi:hypothetical protein
MSSIRNVRVVDRLYQLEGDVNYLNRIKSVLRRQSIIFDKRRTCLLEACAGKGLLTEFIYATNYGFIVCIEKDKDTFSSLRLRLRRYPNVRLLNADSVDLLNDDILGQCRLSAVDVDTFGQPLEIIEALFKNMPRPDPILLMVTDGGLYSAGRRFDDDIIGKYYGKGKGFTLSNVYEKFEYLHTNFVSACAKKYGLRARPLLLARNKKGTAMYSSFRVERAS